MKSIIILFISFFMFSVSYSQQFEGKIAMRLNSDKAKDVDYLIKGNKMRIEMPGNKEGVIIFDTKESKFLMIMPEQKMYMEMPINLDHAAHELNNEDKDADINFTGETKVINGYQCEKWLINDEGKEVEAWMAKELGGFYMFQSPMDKSSKASWQGKLEAGSYFPMQVLENGQMVMEVLSVDKKSLNDDLFKAPKEFQKFEMPGMNHEMLKNMK